MNVSPQEKEKLRKRLQKLFQNQENVKGSANDTTSHQHKGQKTKGDLNNSRNKKNQEVAPMQKATEKQSSGNKKYPKHKNFSLTKEVPKLQKKTNATAKIKATEEPPSKKQSQNTRAKISCERKHLNCDKMAKKTTKGNEFGYKSKENVKIESNQMKKGAKVKSDIGQQNNAAANSYTNINKLQSKKAKKRAVDGVAVSHKKQKLIKKTGLQNNAKISMNEKVLSDDSNSSYENEYDVDYMPGCVPGGDFDSDSNDSDNEDRYWMQEEISENDSEHHNMHYSENDSEEDTAIQNEIVFGSDDSSSNASEANRKFKECPKTDLNPYNQNNYSQSEEEYFDSDNEFETEYSDSDSFEEEDYNFSNDDEDDYEEEEDIHDYTSESDEESFSVYDLFSNGMPYEYYHSDSDKDYELPKHVAEDLIIHNGTSSKHDLKPEDNVCFDSDIDELQIVELEEQKTVKIIEQPKAYDKEELLKLNVEENTSSCTFQQSKQSLPNDDDECPKLVPIVDEDGFQLYNPNEKLDDGEEEVVDGEEESENYGEESMEEYEEDNMDDISLGSEYTEIDSDDADSLLSEDINEKYLNRNNNICGSSDSIPENIWLKKHKPDVIDATGYKCENSLATCSNQSEVSLNDDIKQIPSVNLYENVDLKTECSILSTTIIDNKIHFSNDNFERSLSAKSIEAQETEDIPTTQQEHKLQDDENSADASPKATKSYMHSLANYNTKFFNAFNSNLVMVILKDPFYIYGTVRLTLLAGSMEVYGHSLKLNTEVEIFSPRGCSVIEISALPTKDNISKEDLKELLKSYKQQFGLNDLEKIVNLYNAETDAVVVLKRNDERRKVVQQYKKFMTENVFPNINNINADRPLYNSEYLLRCMINTSAQEQKCLRLPEEWQQFKLTSSSRVMLAGGKSVGKSTLLRYLVNRHLPQKVLLIDLDIGQPEVFIPQTVSCTIIEQPLLGPGFLLNLQPEIAFAVGHTNIALCAHKYLSAVHSLLAYCREQEAFKDIPWLFNTMGYNKGFGLELISVLVQEPLTDVIQLQSSKEINNFECTLQAHVLSNVPHILFSEEYERIREELKVNWNYRLHIWKSAVQQESRFQKEWEMSAKDLRFAMLLARLSQALQGHADWLTDVKPLSASLNDLKIINLLDNTPLVSAEELEKSLEANLVYLCHYEEDSKPLKCLGIGVVRAVDFHVRHLYLIPALPYSQLKYVNCLAIGDMPLPTSLFTNQGPRIKNIAPFVYNTVAASASKAIKQIYHRPTKFLTGKHKALD